MKRKRSSLGQFRQRIPLDVRDKVRGLTLDIPVGKTLVRKRVSDGAVEIVLSLRSREPREIIERQANAVAYLERVYQGLRTRQPVSLTHRQAVKLSEEFYRAWADGEDEVVVGVEIGVDSARSVELCAGGPRSGESGDGTLDSAFPDPDAASAIWGSLMQSPTVDAARLGLLIDRFLLGKGLNVTEASREMVLHETERALRDAFAKRQRNAEGDYSPDPKAARFPSADVPEGSGAHCLRTAQDEHSLRASPKRASLRTLDALLTRWKDHPEQKHVAQSTIAAYAYIIRFFNAFVKKRHRRTLLLSEITKQDVLAFLDDRMEAGIKPKTVRDNDLACLKSLLSWAVGKGMLKDNPAAGVRVKIRQGPIPKRKEGGRGFSDEEAKVILLKAAGYRRASKREDAKAAAAKRWVPWLCAYTGTRVGEMLQLRKKDVVKAGEFWVLAITYEAGTNKRKMDWDVPLHPHLIEQGFLQFVEGAEDGHLFITPRPDLYRADAPESRTKDPHGILGPLTATRNRLREFVREVVTNPDVSPNHGWRHRFKTVGRECKIDSIVLDKFAGHAPKNVSDGYGDVTIKTMHDALMTMPRYELPHIEKVRR